MPLPLGLKYLFGEVDFEALEIVRDREFILPRVLEFGCLEDIRWLIAEYGLDSIHTFLRDRGHVELTQRTINFWKIYLHAKEETWTSPRAWRQNSSARWIG